jgi:hypothetical protein
VLLLAVAFFGIAVLPRALVPWGTGPHDRGTFHELLLRSLALGLLLFVLLAGVSVLRSPAPSLAAVALSGVLPVLAAIPTAVPVDGGIRPFKEAAEGIRAGEEGGPPAPLAAYRKRLPSLSFYARRKVAWPHTPEALAAFLDGPGERWVLIRGRHLEALAGLPPSRVGKSMKLAGDWRLLLFDR